MGYRIEQMRKERKMTQEQLAEKSGVSRQTINAIENNELHDVRFSTLSKIADALETTVQNLFFTESV